MKKLAIMAVAAVMALALAGCGSSSPASSSASASASASAMSASDTSASISSESAASKDPLALEWVKAKTAADAAKGAGLKSFSAPADGTNLSIGELGTGGWTFLYTKDIAEADGGVGAASVVVRKSATTGDNTAKQSTFTEGWKELDGMDYANEWKVRIGDTEVTCFGNVEDQASKMIWDADSNGYSVLVLGQGDDWADFGISEDDVEALVNAVIAANTEKKESSSAAAQPAEPEQQSNGLTQADVEQMIFNAGLGEFVSYNEVQDANGNWTIEVMTRGADGNSYVSVLDYDGNVLVNGYDEAQKAHDPVVSQADVEQMVWNAGFGELVSYQPVQDEDGDWTVEVTTRGADGSEYLSVFDLDGNVLYDGYAEGHVVYDGATEPDPDDEADDEGDLDVVSAVWENGLGELVSYEQTTDASGNTVYEIVTRGADGNEYSSVLDAYGNVLENGYTMAHPEDADDYDDDEV